METDPIKKIIIAIRESLDGTPPRNNVTALINKTYPIQPGQPATTPPTDLRDETYVISEEERKNKPTN